MANEARTNHLRSILYSAVDRLRGEGETTTPGKTSRGSYAFKVENMSFGLLERIRR